VTNEWRRLWQKGFRHRRRASCVLHMYHVPCTMYAVWAQCVSICAMLDPSKTLSWPAAQHILKTRVVPCCTQYDPPRIVCLRAGGGGRFVVIAATSCCTYYAATPLLHSASLRCSNKICPSALLAPLLCCYSLVLPLSLVLR